MSEYALGPAARATKAELLDGTYTPPEPRLVDLEEVIAAIRPEMYEIGAVIGSDVVSQMKERLLDDSPTYGLISRDGHALTRVTTWDDMHAALKSTVGYFAHYMYELPDEYKPGYDRLTDLVAAAYKADPTAGRGRYSLGARGFIQAGLNTSVVSSLGAHVAIDTLLRAPLHGERPAADRFRQVARRSMNRLISPFTMDNVDRMPAYRRAILINLYRQGADQETLKEPEPFVFNPNLLHVLPDVDAPKACVDFKVPPEDLIDAYTGQRIGDIPVKYSTLTCLGTVMFPGVEVATRTVWDWTTNIVTGIQYKDR